MLVLENVHWKIAAKSILTNISLQVRAGELLVVLGANGAGKSSLLQLMAGATKPSRGRIRLKGRALKDYSAKALAQQRAVLPQKTQMAFDLSVLDTVALGRYAYGELPQKSQTIALEQLRALGLQAYAERGIWQLSGGQQQRVHWARCLCQLHQESPEAKLLLLDEPTASLDLQYQHEVLQKAQQLAHEKGYAVLAILHDLNLAAQYADRLLFLRKGKQIGIGPVAQLLQPDTIRACFGVEAVVQQHPVLNCPTVLTYGAAARTTTSSFHPQP